MNTPPTLALIVAYWLHMLATVVWVGGLVSLAWVVIPAARKSLDNEAYLAFLGRLQTRLQGIGWFSLLILAGTGMFQMISHPSYGGFLAIDNPWAQAILIKHLAIGGMVVASAYLTWGLAPGLRRLALLQAAGRDVDETQRARLQAQEAWLLRINVLLSIVVLALTAWARAS
jgi:uncharacterized membrane protein